MFYALLYKLASISFNILNLLSVGKLPPFVCVRVIVEEQDKYLIIEHSPNRFAFPGGFMRWDEQPIQAIQRESKEETGLQLHIGDMIGCYSDSSSRFDRMSTLTICYTGEVVSGELSRSVEGQPVWLFESEFRSKLDAVCQDMFDDYFRMFPQLH